MKIRDVKDKLGCGHVNQREEEGHVHRPGGGGRREGASWMTEENLETVCGGGHGKDNWERECDPLEWET